jgi:hypothetical protein
MTNSSLVAGALRGNALFSALSGGVLVAGAGAWSRHFGLPSPWLLAAVGVALLAFALTVYRTGRARPLRRRDVLAISGLDLAWVAGSAALLLAHPTRVTSVGRGAVALTAAPVALFALLQLAGLRHAPATSA